MNIEEELETIVLTKIPTLPKAYCRFNDLNLKKREQLAQAHLIIQEQLETLKAYNLYIDIMDGLANKQSEDMNFNPLILQNISRWIYRETTSSIQFNISIIKDFKKKCEKTRGYVGIGYFILAFAMRGYPMRFQAYDQIEVQCRLDRDTIQQAWTTDY